MKKFLFIGSLISFFLMCSVSVFAALGDIEDLILDTLTFSTTATELKVTPVSGNIYAIVYSGTDSDGYITTVEINPTTGAVSNKATYEYDNADTRHPDIIHVSGNVYAIAYAGTDTDGFVKTVTISTDGLTIADTGATPLEFDTSAAWTPEIIHVSGDVYAIAYNGDSGQGIVRTITIESDGDPIANTGQSLTFDSSAVSQEIVNVSGTTYAIFYTSTDTDGFIKTFTIENNGNIGTVLDTFEFDTTNAVNPEVEAVYGNIFAVAYGHGSPTNDGYIKTIEIGTNGVIDDGTAVKDTFVYDSGFASGPNLSHMASNMYVLTWVSAAAVDEAKIASIEIENDGTIAASLYDQTTFTGTLMNAPQGILASNDVTAVVYKGSGKVSTFGVDSTPLATVPEFKTYVYIGVLLLGFVLIVAGTRRRRLTT